MLVYYRVLVSEAFTYASCLVLEAKRKVIK